MDVILWATVLASAALCVVIACRLLLRSKTEGLGEVSQNNLSFSTKVYYELSHAHNNPAQPSFLRSQTGEN